MTSEEAKAEPEPAAIRPEETEPPGAATIPSETSTSIDRRLMDQREDSNKRYIFRTFTNKLLPFNWRNGFPETLKYFRIIFTPVRRR